MKECRTALGRLESAPHLFKLDGLWTILPFILWFLLVLTRPVILKTHCSAPGGCSPADILSVDRPGLGVENSDADGYSYFTQNLSGGLAVAVPLVWNGASILLETATPSAFLLNAGTDLVLFAQTWGWNGVATEAVRLISQRPRPFVYGDAVRAQDPQNYVSFYSGHTSFAAAAMVCLLLILVSRRAPTSLLVITLLGGEGLVISTAVFRILAGRHFLSDVIAGALMGTLVGFFVAYAHRKP